MEPVQTFDMEHFMAAIERRRRDARASRSKRLSGQRFAALPLHALSMAAPTVVAACILVAGCSGDDDRTAPAAAAAAEATPMLPGTRGPGEAKAGLGAGAQRFETVSPAPERDAQAPLLPPVMHSVD
jgi:hypothetical protein